MIEKMCVCRSLFASLRVGVGSGRKHSAITFLMYVVDFSQILSP